MKTLLLVFFMCDFINVAILYEDSLELESDGVTDHDRHLEEPDNNVDSEDNKDYGNEEPYDGSDVPNSGCWMTLDAPKLFKTLDKIDEQYKHVRENAQKSMMKSHFDQTMISGLVSSKGAAVREVHHNHHRAWLIPSGINLGGHGMIRMADSILFFHRMKLRNNTHFRVTSVRNNISDLAVVIHLEMHDLHLKGAYERTLTDTDPSVLIYAPSFGEVEFLLRNVKYVMEGRYRIIHDRLIIELATSTMNIEDVLMTYMNQAIESASISIEKENLGAFLGRLQTDLDTWMKDYFNDYLSDTRIDVILEHEIDDMEKYDKEISMALQEFTDSAIAQIKARLKSLNAEVIMLPSFTLKSIQGLEIKLFEGSLYGLDSMFRRSVPTGLKVTENVRKVDTIVGFSSLKVVYKYEATIPTGLPPVPGEFTLTANEIAAHLTLSVLKDPETIDIDVEFLDQMKPESLTVEGAANIVIANFKHLLEHEIVTLMSTSLIHGIELLRSLPRCVPFIPGQLPSMATPQEAKETSNEAVPSAPSQDSKIEDDYGGNNAKRKRLLPSKNKNNKQAKRKSKKLKHNKNKQTKYKKT